MGTINLFFSAVENEIFNFSIRITTFYDISSFLKIIGNAFWTKYVFSLLSHVSCTENQNLQFFLRSKKVLKITKKLITEVIRVQQTMWQKVIQTDREGGTYVSIYWLSISHYKYAFFQLWKVLLILETQH